MRRSLGWPHLALVLDPVGTAAADHLPASLSRSSGSGMALRRRRRGGLRGHAADHCTQLPASLLSRHRSAHQKKEAGGGHQAKGEGYTNLSEAWRETAPERGGTEEAAAQVER